MASDGFGFSWDWVPGATYELQIDDDPFFGSPVAIPILDEPVYSPASPLPGGAYYWRVRSILPPGIISPWSAPMNINNLEVNSAQPVEEGKSVPSPVVEVELTILWTRGEKSTRLLCLDGDNEGDSTTDYSEESWDAVHPEDWFEHGENNCTRASIAMITSKYTDSLDLSVDRLAYQLFENQGNPIWNIGQVGDPRFDLGHTEGTRTCGADGNEARTLLAWALGVDRNAIFYSQSKPSFAQIRTWIDNGQPVMRSWNGHSTVIGGYRVLDDGTEQVLIFDTKTRFTWESYNKVEVVCHYVAPASAPNVRSDEPGISTDTDDDGIHDWDELTRFHTDPNLKDSDGDGVEDKQDLREYVFRNDGTYELRNPNFDGDQFRKERDRRQ